MGSSWEGVDKGEYEILKSCYNKSLRNDKTVYVVDQEIVIAGKDGIINKVSVEEFSRRPSAVFSYIKMNLMMNNSTI